MYISNKSLVNASYSTLCSDASVIVLPTDDTIDGPFCYKLRLNKQILEQNLSECEFKYNNYRNLFILTVTTCQLTILD